MVQREALGLQVSDEDRPGRPTLGLQPTEARQVQPGGYLLSGAVQQHGVSTGDEVQVGRRAANATDVDRAAARRQSRARGVERRG